MSSYPIRSSIESAELIEDFPDGQGPYHWNGVADENEKDSIFNYRFGHFRVWALDKLDKLKGITGQLRLPPLHFLLAGIGISIVFILIVMGLAGAFHSQKPENIANDGVSSRNQKLVEDSGNVFERTNNELQGLRASFQELQNQNKLLQEENSRIKNGGVDSNTQDEWTSFKAHFNNQSWGSELLFSAVSQKNENAIKMLVTVGADLNGRNNKSETPLIKAALIGDKVTSVRIVKYLIEQGADVIAEDDKGRTFLHNLLSDGTSFSPFQLQNMGEYLISGNHSTLFDNPAGIKEVTPLMLAVKNVDVQNATLTLLHNNGVNFTALDMDGDGLLKYALEGKRGVGILSLLVNLGANPQIANKYGFSLLHFAAYFGQIEELKFLVNLGLDINKQDGHGTTPLHLVAFHGTRENAFKTVRFLKEHGADATIMNQSNKSPVDDARLNGKLNRDQREELVELLEQGEVE